MPDVSGTRTGLVGRDASLAELRAAVERAEQGLPSVVLLSGETGVGKTALVREAARDERLTLLYGGCIPVAGEPLPFAPLIQALRRLGATAAVRRQVQRSPDLARLLPTWGPPEAAGVVEETATDSTKLALFQAVLELVERLGAPGPVLFAVEDLHWADRSTLDLLRYLATNLTAERVVLVATYRADEVAPTSALAGWLAELGRLPITRRLALDRLGPEQTTLLIARLVADPDPALVGSTLARSAGNPLFVEHLLRQPAGDPALPTTLHDLLLARVRTQSEDTQALLRALAVLARPAEIELVAQLLAAEPAEVERQARPALDQHVLEARSDGDAIGFAHPAFGEVVYGGLLGTERTRLHRRAAEALESRPDSAPGELARHWLAAGDDPRALTASIAAGEAAETMYAFADAQVAFGRAAELARALGQGPDLRSLLGRAAQASYLAGDAEEAIHNAEAALAEPGDAESELHLCERLGAFHFVAGHGEESERCLRRGLDARGDAPDSTLTARIYARLAMATAAWSRPDDAEVWCERGLEAARAVGARREEGLVRNALGIVAVLRGDVPTAIEHERSALAIARDTGGADDLALAYVNLTHVLGLGGDLDEVAQIGREGSRLLTRIGLASQFGSLLEANACEALISSGRLAEAEELVAEALAHEPRGIMGAPALMQAGRLAALRGRLDIAWDHCERARLALESEGAPDSWLRLVAEAAIEVELWAGHPDAAYELVLDQLNQLAGTDEEPFTGLLVAFALRALADQSERRRDAESRRRISELRAPIDAAAARCAESGMPHDAALRAWQSAERARIDHVATVEDWVAVREEWAVLGQVVAASYAAWREAEARLDAGVDAAAIAAVRELHATAMRLGLPLLADEAERLAGWHRIDLIVVPEQRSGPSAAEDPLAAYRLTGREREVLQALAEGRTNREIAEALFISVKTASVHVSNILRKLEVSGRQEAARVAHRLGVG